MQPDTVTESARTINVRAKARELAPKLVDAESFFRNHEAMRNVVDLFIENEKLPFNALVGRRGEERAREEWAAMPWDERLARIERTSVSPQDIALMRSLVDPRGSFWEFTTTAVKIVEEAQACKTFPAFAAFVARWTEEDDFVESAPQNDTVVVYAAGKATYYFYHRESYPAKAAWHHVVERYNFLRETWELLQAERKEKEAERRVRWERVSAERTARTDDLVKEVTPGLTLSEIVGGKIGKILLRLDADRVALLDFLAVKGDCATVQIPRTNYNRLVWRPITVSLSDFFASDGYWPDDRYGFPLALQEQLQIEQEDRELEQRLATLRVEDLLPSEPAQPSMTRVLFGEPGSALAYHLAFMDNSATGFLGVTISFQDGKFVLAAAESDLPFSRDLVGKELPLTIQDMGEGNAPHITMSLAGVPEEHKKTLDMIRRLLVFRVNRENKDR